MSLKNNPLLAICYQNTAHLTMTGKALQYINTHDILQNIFIYLNKSAQIEKKTWYQRAALYNSSIIYKVYENKVHNIAVLIAKLKNSTYSQILKIQK